MLYELPNIIEPTDEPPAGSLCLTPLRGRDFHSRVTHGDQRERLILASVWHMSAHDDLTWEQFEHKFREAFGRDMTHDEHQWFHAVWKGVQTNEQEKLKGAAA